MFNRSAVLAHTNANALTILPRLARFCADRQYVANHAIAFLLKIDAKPSQRRQCAVNGGLMSYGTRSGCPRLPVAVRTSRRSSRGRRKSNNIHASSGVIWGIPAKRKRLPVTALFWQ
jgi:hypothetical protein